MVFLVNLVRVHATEYDAAELMALAGSLHALLLLLTRVLAVHRLLTGFLTQVILDIFSLTAALYLTPGKGFCCFPLLIHTVLKTFPEIQGDARALLEGICFFIS